MSWLVPYGLLSSQHPLNKNLTTQPKGTILSVSLFVCVCGLSISDLQTSSTGWAIGIHRVHIDWLRSSDDKPISNWVTYNLSETKVTQYRIYTHQSIQYCRIYLSLHNFKVKQHLCEALSRTCKDTAVR